MPPLQLDGLIGQSDEIKQIFSIVEKVAGTESTILITGETGTGKGLIARAIHQNSNRADRPFVAINCGALPENLLESELFGHTKGAFTGAFTSKNGKFEQANSGTIFLDEIGDMSPDLQVKILRVLEENEFEKVGGNRTIAVNIRVIAATHRDLEERVEQGLFREDLFYRLFVIPLHLPPLRERRSDIPLLARHFHDQFNRRNNLALKGFTEDALGRLNAYAWPGNIRELKNLVERLVVLKQTGWLQATDLPTKIRGTRSVIIPPPAKEISESGIPLATAVTEFEKALILQSLEKAKWVKNKAAKLLHLNRTTLVEKIKRYEITPSDVESNV